MICLAHFPEDKEAIVCLWQECFEDTREYTNFFIENLPLENAFYVYKKDNHVVGMLLLMPGRLNLNLKDNKKKTKAYYVYAVGVADKYRKQGIAEALLRHIREYARTQEAELCLVPQSEKLRQYYERRGFLNTFVRFEYNVEIAKACETGDNLIFEELDVGLCESEQDKKINQIYKRREEVFTTLGAAFLWDFDNFKFALLENQKCGGFTYLIRDDYLIGYCDGLVLRIKETSLPFDCLSAAAASLALKYECTQAVFFNVPDTGCCENIKRVSYAMLTNQLFGKEISCFDEKECYINLCLD